VEVVDVVEVVVVVVVEATDEDVVVEVVGSALGGAVAKVVEATSVSSPPPKYPMMPMTTRSAPIAIIKSPRRLVVIPSTYRDRADCLWTSPIALATLPFGTR
jgi:hypothetical protein